MSSSSSNKSPSVPSSAPASVSSVDYLYWEQQESALCGVHALNNLLQGPYYTAIDLSTIASQLKDAETALMAAGGTATNEYLSYIAADSSFVDESGNFSVEVLKKALEVLGLQLIPISPSSKNPLAVATYKNPTMEIGFIANYKDHWLALRKINNKWFNLNSILDGPEVISDFYLSAFLGQLINEGYIVFVVQSNKVNNNNNNNSSSDGWPRSLDNGEGGDNYLLMDEVLNNKKKGSPNKKPRKTGGSGGGRGGGATSSSSSPMDQQLARALAMSKAEAEENNKRARNNNNNGMDEDEELQRALSLSMQAAQSSTNNNNTNNSNNRTNNNNSNNSNNINNASNPIEIIDDDDQDDELKCAIALSLQQGTLNEK